MLDCHYRRIHWRRQLNSKVHEYKKQNATKVKWNLVKLSEVNYWFFDNRINALLRLAYYSVAYRQIYC